MEEKANLLWVGYVLAENGPPGFQHLWAILIPAVTHYIYGLNADEAACEKAASQIKEYAAALESMVINGEVRSTPYQTTIAAV
jgi:hypothetical protein